MASDPARTHPSEFPVLALRETVVLPREEMSDAQRQYFLRQQLKAVQDELGEGDTPEAQELRRRNAIREKALAARRYGITTFVPPARHEPDLAELPPEVRRDMRFVPADTLEDVLEVALPR